MNGDGVAISEGLANITLSADNGIRVFDITAEDEAGNVFYVVAPGDYTFTKQ